MADYVVHVGYPEVAQAEAFCKRYADRYGLELKSVSLNESAFKTCDVIKHAAFAMIWNGQQQSGELVSSVCRQMRIPHAYFEFGALPQSQTYSVDESGFCCKSSLRDSDLRFVSSDDMNRLELTRSALQLEHRFGEVESAGDILVPLQIENDTQILHSTPYRTMDEFIFDVCETFGAHRITFKKHPKSKTFRHVPEGAAFVETGDFLDLAAAHSLVIGLTSTCLFEAAVMGCRVLAIGDHPLSLRYSRAGPARDKLLAAYLSSIVDRDLGDASMVLERRGVRPLGCTPIQPPSLPLVLNDRRQPR